MSMTVNRFFMTVVIPKHETSATEFIDETVLFLPQKIDQDSSRFAEMFLRLPWAASDMFQHSQIEFQETGIRMDRIAARQIVQCPARFPEGGRRLIQIRRQLIAES